MVGRISQMDLSASMIVDVEKSFFVIIDVQQRLLSAMPDAIGKSVVKQARILLQAAQTLAIPVAITEQYPKGLGATVSELQRDDITIEKTCFSCADSDDFMASLYTSHRKQVVLAGMESHICVLQTALALLEQGYQVFVVEDAVCSRTELSKDNSMQRLRQAGVIITSTESVLFEWLKDAKHPEFKTLSKLII